MHRTASALVRESQHQTMHIKGIRNQGAGREGRRGWKKGEGEKGGEWKEGEGKGELINDLFIIYNY